MARTLLEMVRQAANELGIPEPSFLFGNANDQEKQLIALSNREGKEFSGVANKNGGWQNLHNEYTFNTVVGQANYPLPADLEYFLEKTFWDDKYKWALIGPTTAQEKQILRYGVIASGPRNKFYIRKNEMWLDPIPQDVQLVAYDYYSNCWCQSATGVPQKTWMNDTDTYLLDEECFIEGLKWRFLRAKGFDYAEEFNSYTADVQRTISRDGGTRDLSLNSNGYQVQFLNGENIPQTGFGQP